MLEVGRIVGTKYRVDSVCSDSGGMGMLLFVTSLGDASHGKLVLKYCRETDEEQLKRFRREVRLLASFQGNSKVVQILDQNLDHEPPYFVMKYYPDGDLSKLAEKLRASYEFQESCFLQMIDCLQELHSRNEFHRDIKPQNFLCEGDGIVVSDFGLTTEVGSDTAFTRSSMFWGTHGYIPPEFLNGGFKHADAAGDIFMLGKTFYVLLTGRDPLYIEGDGVPPPIFHIIRRCCGATKRTRYQTLSELKQSLVSAYDVMLGRAGGIGKTKQLLSAIEDRLKQDQEFDVKQMSDFVEELAVLDENDQINICKELTPAFFHAISQEHLADRVTEFLRIYEKLVETKNYAWSYAETIAEYMRVIFWSESLPPEARAHALDVAVRSATYMNRFAAMNICRSMVTSIRSEDLGFRVGSIIQENPDTFLSSIEPAACDSDAIRSALRQIQQRQPGTDAV